MMRKSRSEWAGLVKRWRTSGLTAEAFAQREGLKANTLRWWDWSLGQATAPAFVEVQLPAQQGSQGQIELLVRGVPVRVSGDFDASVLQRVLAVLEER